MLSISSLLIGEVEEQLHILEDLAPDWISKKVINGGEILYRQVSFGNNSKHPFFLDFHEILRYIFICSIEPITDQNSVRERLVEAV
jgi:chromatin licensing and DNA replication factor 1